MQVLDNQIQFILCVNVNDKMRFKITVALLVISYLFLPISHSVSEVKKKSENEKSGVGTRV
jgi:hypothetical protein